MKVGEGVEKIKGYRWPGVVVAEFMTLSGQLRYVLECTVPEVPGALHINSPDKIVRVEWAVDTERSPR